MRKKLWLLVGVSVRCSCESGLLWNKRGITTTTNREKRKRGERTNTHTRIERAHIYITERRNKPTYMKRRNNPYVCTIDIQNV